jgi:hypothetical protein
MKDVSLSYLKVKLRSMIDGVQSLNRKKKQEKQSLIGLKIKVTLRGSINTEND